MDHVKNQQNNEKQPVKPVFNVFQNVEILTQKINDAVDVVKQEKKWLVL